MHDPGSWEDHLRARPQGAIYLVEGGTFELPALEDAASRVGARTWVVPLEGCRTTGGFIDAIIEALGMEPTTSPDWLYDQLPAPPSMSGAHRHVIVLDGIDDLVLVRPGQEPEPTYHHYLIGDARRLPIWLRGVRLRREVAVLYPAMFPGRFEWLVDVVARWRIAERDGRSGAADVALVGSDRALSEVATALRETCDHVRTRYDARIDGHSDALMGGPGWRSVDVVDVNATGR